MQLQFVTLTADQARTVLAWQYPPPYELYNNTDLEGEALENEIAFLADPANQYLAMLDDAGTLIGYAGTGIDAQVAGGDYSLKALDVGIGLRPDFTGRGLGAEILAALLDYYVQQVHPVRFRATIATFNLRSQRVFEKNGFQRSITFKRPSDELEFIIFIKERLNDNS